MRPQGEISLALLAAAPVAAPDQAGYTLRELAAAAQVGYDAAKTAVQNLQRAKHLVQRKNARRVAHSRRPVAEYVRAEPGPEVGQLGATAAVNPTPALRAWVG